MKKGLLKMVMLGALLICMLSVVETTDRYTDVQVCGSEDFKEDWGF